MADPIAEKSLPTGHEFRVSGMTCTGCASGIERRLSEMPEVAAVAVNFAAKTAHITADLSGEALIRRFEELGYGASPLPDPLAADDEDLLEIRQAGQRALLASLLTLPVFIYGMFGRDWPGSAWLQFILTTVVMVTVGLPFHKKALLQARAFSANMDSLVSLGTLAAWCFSLWSWTAGHRHLYFESAAVIITFITIGRWLEERAKFSTREALRSLAALQPRTAVLLAGAAMRPD